MFDYKQRPTTSEYRENWERIFGLKSGETYFFNESAWKRKFGGNDAVYRGDAQMEDREAAQRLEVRSSRARAKAGSRHHVK